MHQLSLMKGEASSGSGWPCVLSDGRELTLGRTPDNDISFPDNRSVSGLHARLTGKGSKWSIEDCSRNGTRVNGQKVSLHKLAVGDVIEVGGVKLGFEQVGGSEDEPATAEKAGAAVSASSPAFDDDDDNYVVSREFEDLLSIKRRIHQLLFERLDLRKMSQEASDEKMRQEVEEALDQLLSELRYELPENCDTKVLRKEVIQECLGLGPLEPLLEDKDIDEIMVNRHDRIFVERNGKLMRVPSSFVDDQQLMAVIERIVLPLGRRIDESSPMVDARLPNGSRVNAIIPPLAINGPSVTIRKFPESPLRADDLIRFGAMTEKMRELLCEAVRTRQNIVVSGGTGSGKTTLLNVLSRAIPPGERIVTIEDSAELQLDQDNIVRLESRPANVEGRGAVLIRDLVVNSLRMRPDRIIVGECRSGESLDMLQAMNTGHDGSLTTVHANSPKDVLMRLETMVLMAGMELPSRAIREQIASAVNLIVQQSRFEDGSRKITYITEITGRDGDVITMQDICRFESKGRGPDGKVLGEYKFTGNVPRFAEMTRASGSSKLAPDFFNE